MLAVVQVDKEFLVRSLSLRFDVLSFSYELFKGVTHLLIGSLIATAGIFGGGILFAISYGLITNDWQFYAL